ERDDRDQQSAYASRGPAMAATRCWPHARYRARGRYRRVRCGALVAQHPRRPRCRSRSIGPAQRLGRITLAARPVAAACHLTQRNKIGARGQSIAGNPLWVLGTAVTCGVRKTETFFSFAAFLPVQFPARTAVHALRTLPADCRQRALWRFLLRSVPRQPRRPAAE